MNLYEHTIVASQDVSPAQIKQLTEKYNKIDEKNNSKDNSKNNSKNIGYDYISIEN